MSNETIASKIDLLQDKIDNFEKSGFFTEKEIDKQSFPLYKEMESLMFQFEVTDVEILTPNHITA